MQHFVHYIKIFNLQVTSLTSKCYDAVLGNLNIFFPKLQLNFAVAALCYLKKLRLFFCVCRHNIRIDYLKKGIQVGLRTAATLLAG